MQVQQLMSVPAAANEAGVLPASDAASAATDPLLAPALKPHAPGQPEDSREATPEAAFAALFGLPLNETPELVPAPDAALSAEPPVAAAESPPTADDDVSALEGAEQWLQGMLGQQALSVTVREPSPRPAASEALPVETPGAAPAIEAQARAATTAATAPGARAVSVRQGPSAAAENVAAQAPLEVPVQASLLAETSAPEGREGARRPAIERASAGLPASLAIGSPAAASSLPAAADPAVLAPPAAAPGEQTLRLQTPEARWGEQMVQALRDNVELQLRNGSQQATIRLDPAELGHLEIQLSHESGRLQVQIHASQGDVARMLQQTSDRLRQELVGQNLMQVSVQVSSDGQSGQRQAPRESRQLLAEALPAAARETGEDTGSREGRARDVLVTV